MIESLQKAIRQIQVLEDRNTHLESVLKRLGSDEMFTIEATPDEYFYELDARIKYANEALKEE